MKYTENEIKFIRRHFELTEDACGAEMAEHLVDDNYSFASPSEFYDLFNKNSIPGIMGSLCKKGVVVIEDANSFYFDESFLEELPQDVKFVDLDL